MDLQNFKYKDITEKIIGVAMKVHSTLGNGFQEIIYQRAMGIELQDAGINFQSEFSMPIFYKEKLIGKRRVDFFYRRKSNGRNKSSKPT